MKRHTFLFACFIALNACNSDVEDAQIEGVVVDAATGLPIPKASLRVENACYQGGDYDSYSGYDSLKIITDSVGLFQLQFSKSANLQVKAYKTGYQSGFIAKDIISKNSKLVISLKKQ